MRGANETTVIAAIIIIIACIIIVAYVLYASGKTTQPLPSMRDFYWYCTFWSSNHYSGENAYMPNGTSVSMRPYCSAALGIGPPDKLTATDMNNCRNKCRGANITSG